MGLLDIVGSFAGAGANILSRQNKEAEELETRKQLADHQAKLEAQKLDTIERLKEERLRKQQDELVAADDKATTRAKELGTARRMDDFKAKLGQTDATEAELQEAFKQYDNKAVQAGDKTDTQFMDKRRADAAGDYVKAARETGNTGLLSQAKQSMDFAVKQDDADAKTAREERKAEETERRNREAERQRDEREGRRDERENRRLDIYASKGGGSSGNGRTDPTYRLALTTQLNAANRDVTELRKSLEAFDDNLVNKNSTDPAVAKKRERLQTDLDEAIQTKKTLLKQFDGLGAQPSDEGSTKPSGSKPSGGQSGTGSVATPKSNAEFNSLPKGALYVNPKDGKTYTKN